ncbi:MAG TPA: carbohydrate porin, partial [Vicinamibacterales bacterium]|nr:carbohydrate porin [Vicinamibacterales bacterium]
MTPGSSNTWRTLLALCALLALRGTAIAQVAQQIDPRSTGPTSADSGNTSSVNSAPPDSSSPSSSDWSGFYVGTHVGSLGGSSSWSATQAGAPPLSGSLGLFQSYGLADGSGSHFAGLSAGYNFPLKPRVVLGAEADLSFGAEPAMNGATYNDTPLVSGTARGRVGYLSRHGLYYATGGLAWTHDLFNTDSVSASFERIGFSLGGGLEAPLTSRWSAKAEYLYSSFGGTDLALPDGTHFISDLSMHQIRAGLTYRLLNGPGLKDRPKEPTGSIGIVPLDLAQWSVHGQTTFLSQFAPPFHAPYSGPNSLASNSGRETWDATLYAGRRLWKGAELWFNPEIDQGFGLSNTLGVAGFTSGEAYKVGYRHPYLRVPRIFVRQTIDLGGETQKVEANINQFEGSQTTNRLVITAGRFSVSDIFDSITYAHDPRNDFMNWSLADSGTFDYAADAWGFTYGAAVEWYYEHWTARA